MDMSPQAKKLWEQIPQRIRVRLLNNVWCVACGKETGVGNAKAVVEKGDIVIRGSCTACGGEVARVIESS